MKLLFDPVILLLGIYPKNPETPIQKNYMHPYVHGSVIYNSQDQPKCPSVNERIKKLWCILHSGILHCCEKEGPFTLFNSVDELENIMLSKISQ